MEKKVKNKAVLYGVVAVLLAVIIGALCYEAGFYIPVFSPLEPPSSAAPSAFLATFSSGEDLKSFLKQNSRTQGLFRIYGPFDTRTMNPTLMGPGTMTKAEGFNFEYSTTNVQVAGVDEADTVKTDGQYIYILSNNIVSILGAYPPQMARVLSRISFAENMHPVGIYLNGDRLAVLGSKYLTESYYGYYEGDPETFINAYDITNRADPLLLRTLTFTGSYFNSRMVGEYVYFVVSQAACVVYDTVILPKIYAEGHTQEIAPTEIRYSNGSDEYYQYSTFVAMNIQNVSDTPTYLTVMLGGTGTMYVSLNNVYVTYPEMSGNTTIYRVHIQGKNMTCEARGEVIGRELNQFSMDEYNDHFRIVTTSWVNWTSQTNVYVLGMNLTTVGRLENLGVRENLHSVRFMGNRCYLVTFKKTDPLFVVNVTEPTNPTVLGELKIPGYSDYLHPYDEDHIIGVGKETVEAEGGDFAWYQGVKISLFDVGNVSNPVQTAKYIIGDRGTDSLVLSDHKAFLFDRPRNLLVIPVSVAEVDESQYPYGVPSNAYGTTVWQGAYVFKLTLTDGFVLRGRITHGNEGEGVPPSNYWVTRALYIENVLYTVSDKKVKMNSLDDLTLISSIEL